MIRIKVKEQNNNIKEINFTGHAGYDNLGKDIVCASVSSIFYCSINACYLFEENSLEVFSGENKQKIVVQSENENIQKILINMLNCLKSLEKSYPKNIRIDKEEKE